MCNQSFIESMIIDMSFIFIYHIDISKNSKDNILQKIPDEISDL